MNVTSTSLDVDVPVSPTSVTLVYSSCLGFISGFSTGLLGFGGGILFHLLWFLGSLSFLSVPLAGNLPSAVATVNFNSLTGVALICTDTYKALKNNPNAIHWPSIARLVPGFVFFSLVGTSFLAHAAPSILRRVLGVFFLAVAVTQISKRINVWKRSVIQAAYGVQVVQQTPEVGANSDSLTSKQPQPEPEAGQEPEPQNQNPNEQPQGLIASMDDIDHESSPINPAPSSAAIASALQANASKAVDAAELIAIDTRTPAAPVSLVDRVHSYYSSISTEPCHRLGLLAGVLGGLLDGVFGTGGPPVIYYFSHVGISGTAIRNSYSVATLFTFPSIIISSFLLGIYRAAYIPMYICVPIFAMIGNRVGNYYHPKVRQDLFIILLQCLIMLSSISLCNPAADADIIRDDPFRFVTFLLYVAIVTAFILWCVLFYRTIIKIRRTQSTQPHESGSPQPSLP